MKFKKIPSLKFMYEVSNDGIVRNVKSKKVLSQYKTSNGYMMISTTIKNKNIKKSVHRLVAECWIPIPKRYLDMGLTADDLVINHKDFSRDNNNSENLEWLTQEENVKYSYNSGRYTLEGLKRWHSENGYKYYPKTEAQKLQSIKTLKEYYKSHSSPMKNKKHSENSKELMKNNHKDFSGCNHPRAYKNKVKMILLNSSTETIFENIDKASEYISYSKHIAINTARNQIVRVCSGRRKVAYNANWYFI